MFLNDAKHAYKMPLFQILFTWQRSASIFFLSSASLFYGLWRLGCLSDDLKVPPFPLAVIGGALGIFVSFRTNAAYQRWWEGRKLWGRMINTSRHLCAQAISYLPEDAAREVIHRHIAYVHTLRCALRDEALQEDEHFKRVLAQEERDALVGSTNPNHALLMSQMRCFMEQRRAGHLTEFCLSDLDSSVRHLLDIQGGSERIKKTPFPPAYGYLATALTRIYALFLPLALIHDTGGWVIPCTLIICLTFQLINEVGRVLENPFLNIWPALPLSDISLTIERNLRDALGETDLPDPQPTMQIPSGYVLM